MSGNVSRKQAEGFWNKYNKDGNDELTVEEVTAAVKEVFEGEMEDADVRSQYVFFGQDGPKNLKKEEFIKGMMRTDKCKVLEKAFKEMDTDKSGRLSRSELEQGLAGQGFGKEVADIILDELEYASEEQYSIKDFIETVCFSESFAQSYDC